ncbi:pseudouridine synthase [Salirhabdus salicampi]|uniref:pseudouridine synthase n=1 Tax=Salirhabdus salicampi TaxID=476102 RepID=UPI0020C47E41|nr:pseudouridine synthase [Salirhabdus salicampi]MCP8617167.1 rRNA pseudouridine synthase [Salirhabdus salicampi]
MRLDKLLANMGYGSRKDVKKLLKQGIVQINGDVVKDGSSQVDPTEQKVFVRGEEIQYKQFIYLMMNKPKGVISATEDQVERCVTDLLQPQERIFDPFPVGRLDKDTVGLLLLTNDGQLAHKLLSPKKNIGKRYWALIKGNVTEEDVKAFEAGVTLDDGYKTKPAQLSIITRGDTSEIEVVITEGKFHQIKRMFKAVDKEVIELKRLEMGPLSLDESLPKGSYRELTDEELEAIQNVN